MRKKILIWGSIALVITILIVAINLLLNQNPLRGSEKKIKEDILKLTPIGMNMKDVIKIIEKQAEWEIDYISYEHGYDRLEDDVSIGEKSIRAFIGEYRNIFLTSVTVFWAFNKNSKLIDVYIWKSIDAL